jgi:hypothetical protein
MRSVIRGVVSGLVVAAVALPASAQVRITPTVGYASGGSVEVLDSKLSLGDDITYGGILGFGVANAGTLELVFDWSSVDLDQRDRNGGATSTLGSLDVWSLQAGGVYELSGSPTFRPFLNGGLGITVYNPAEDLSDASAETRFSLYAGLGADAARWLKFGGRMWMSFINTSGGFWCGYGGCAVGAGGEVLVRWEAYAGINLGGRRR